jgi:surface polysaccharide O-acyltransferase-like enzyme
MSELMRDISFIRGIYVMSHGSNSQIQKYSWIDVARTIGAFFVILIHVSDMYTTNLFKSSDLFNWISVVFLNVIPRSAVPLFVIVSGYVLLGKQDSVRKRVGKLVKPLLFWSLFYLLLALALNGKGNLYFVKQLLIRSPFGIWAFGTHLWFLYMLLGLYISLPISRLLFKYLDFKGYIALCIAFLLNSLIYHVTSIWFLITGESVSSFYSEGLGWGSIYFGYFLLPKLIIDNKYQKPKDIYLLLSIVLSTLIAFSLTFFTSLKISNFTKIWGEPQSLLIAIQTFSIILLLNSNEWRLQRIFNKFTILKKIIEISSRHALGIYAVHWFVIRVVFYTIDRASWKVYLNYSLGITIILISIITWLLSLLISTIASKNHFLKQVF